MITIKRDELVKREKELTQVSKYCRGKRDDMIQKVLALVGEGKMRVAIVRRII